MQNGRPVRRGHGRIAGKHIKRIRRVRQNGVFKKCPALVLRLSADGGKLHFISARTAARVGVLIPRVHRVDGVARPVYAHNKHTFDGIKSGLRRNALERLLVAAIGRRFRHVTHRNQPVAVFILGRIGVDDEISVIYRAQRLIYRNAVDYRRGDLQQRFLCAVVLDSQIKRVNDRRVRVIFIVGRHRFSRRRTNRIDARRVDRRNRIPFVV